MTLLTRALGVVFAFAILRVMIWASTAPFTVHDSNAAVMRLAWSARPERVEECRQRSNEELAKLPQHMRQRIVCDGVSAQYRLTVLYDGVAVSDLLLHGGGLRQDRRLYVFHEVQLRPGDARIEVRFDRQGGETPATVSAESRGETVPPHLLLEQRLRIRPREVVLVTYSPERRALLAVQNSARY